MFSEPVEKEGIRRVLLRWDRCSGEKSEFAAQTSTLGDGYPENRWRREGGKAGADSIT